MVVEMVHAFTHGLLYKAHSYMYTEMTFHKTHYTLYDSDETTVSICLRPRVPTVSFANAFLQVFVIVIKKYRSTS